MSGSDLGEVAVHELGTTNLQALLDNLGGELVDAIAIGLGQDVVNDSSLVSRRSMLAQVLDAPIAELSMGDEINVGNDFVDGRSLY